MYLSQKKQSDKEFNKEQINKFCNDENHLKECLSKLKQKRDGIESELERKIVQMSVVLG